MLEFDYTPFRDINLIRIFWSMFSLFTFLRNFQTFLKNANKKVSNISKVKLGDKKRFDKEQIGAKKPLTMSNWPFTS